VESEKVYPVALIVHPGAAARAAIVQSLRDAGFQAVGVDGFAAAKRLLALDRVDVLITEARLGDFHGLHLVMLARSANPAVFAAVLTSEEDAVLQRDIERAGATLFVGSGAESIVAMISRRTTLRPRPGDIPH
jgi:DNA-binding NtrC family response regulator